MNNEITPILDAICRNSVQEVTTLIDKGHKVPVNAIWHFARRYKDRYLRQLKFILPMLKLLKEKGALIVLPEDQSQPISQAIMNGNVDLVMYLLQEGADPNGGGPRGTAWLPHSRGTHRHISHAATNNLDRIIKLLLEHGAIPTENALTDSCANCNINSVRLLLDAGVNPNIQYENPLCIMVEHCRRTFNTDFKNYFNIIELLLQYGADPTMEKVSMGGGARHTAVNLMKDIMSNPGYLQYRPEWGQTEPIDLRREILSLFFTN